MALDRLVAGWTFDETSGNFTDVSSNGQDLAPLGTPFGNGSNGIVGGAMDLNASTDAASNASVGDFGLSDSFTVSFWLYLDDTPNASSGPFLSFLGRRVAGPAAARSGLPEGWSIRNSSGGSVARRQKLALFWFANDGTNNISRNVWTQGDPLDQGWNHLVVTYDGDPTLDGVRVYRDNTLDVMANPFGDDLTQAGYSVTTNEEFAVGKRLDADGGAVGNPGGRIDEVGIWERVLTAKEVNTLWNEGNGYSISNIPEPGTLALLGAGGLFLCSRRRSR